MKAEFHAPAQDDLRFFACNDAKSVCPSVRPSVGPSVCNAFAFRPSRSDVCRVYGLVVSCWNNPPD